jgi:hypothetical protein
MIRTRIRLSAFALAASLVAGCGTMRYGDGKAGPIPLDPAIDALADAADSKVPGTGEKVRDWFATAKAERIPTGYRMRWETLLDGQSIDAARLSKRPLIEPIPGAAAVFSPADLADTNAVPADLLNLIRGAR